MKFSFLITVLCSVVLVGCAAKAPTEDNSAANSIDSESATRQSGQFVAPERSLDQQEKWQFDQAVSQLEAKRFNAAESALKALQKKHPGATGIAVNLAIIDEKRGNLAAAEAQYRALLKAQPGMPAASINLSNLLVQQGKFTEAIKILKASTKVSLNQPLLWYNLAVIEELYRQNLPLAISAYQRYLELIDRQDEEIFNRVKALQNAASSGR